MTEAGYHTPVEEYLEAVYALSEEGTAVIAARVAERLGRSAPSVSEMLDRLEVDGLVERSGRMISLTSTGATLAATVVRRHRLAERLLVDVIGLAWHKAHSEAGRWEHVISTEVEAKLIELLGDPATCPHGNAIPGSTPRPRREECPLIDFVGEGMVEILRISEALEPDEPTMSALEGASAIPGRVVEVKWGPSGRTLEGVSGSITVSDELAAMLFIGAEVQLNGETLLG